MFDLLPVLVLNVNLYSEGGEWSELLRYVQEGGQLLQVLRNQPGSLAAVFKATWPSLLRPRVIDVDEDGMPVNQAARQVPLIAFQYTNRNVLQSDAKWRSVVRPTLARMPKRFRVSGSSPMKKGAVPKASADDRSEIGCGWCSYQDNKCESRRPRDEESRPEGTGGIA